jgi:phage baseplate assembly protein W
MLNIHFPWKFSDRGRTALVDRDGHIRQMVEQVLFTNPGERVNRPDFGCGLLQLVFEPNADQLVAALQTTVQAALQRWLGDVIQLDELAINNDDSKLHVLVSYVVTNTGERRVDTFVRRLA